MRFIFLFLFLTTASVLNAQSSGVAFGGFGYDSSAAVEITADSLDIDQSTGSATFDGNVIIGQGDMRLSANQVVVEYGQNSSGKSEIKRLIATGRA